MSISASHTSLVPIGDDRVVSINEAPLRSNLSVPTLKRCQKRGELIILKLSQSTHARAGHVREGPVEILRPSCLKAVPPAPVPRLLLPSGRSYPRVRLHLDARGQRPD